MAETKIKKQTGGFTLFAGDKVLWVIFIVLAVISILGVYSSSAKEGYNMSNSMTTWSILKKQLLFVAASIVAVAGFCHIDCRHYGRWSKMIFIVCLGLTLLPYVLGIKVNGSSRWLPIFGFMFQPSELLKFATLILLARQLAARQAVIDRIKLIPTFNPVKLVQDKAMWKSFREHTMPILLPVVLACAVILPAHTSSALLVFLVSMVMMYIGRVRKTELFKILLLAVAAGGVFMMLELGRSNVADNRGSAFVETLFKSRKDVPVDKLTDTERSMIAIHEGGLFGKGAGRSTVRIMLTHPECDYTFALLVEEYGLFMALLLLSFYLWIAVRGIVAFTRCETAFPGLLVLGLSLLITIPALLHIFVAVNFFPETGQVLPFVSSGGTAIVCSSIAMGIILSISRQNDEKSHEKPRGESILERG